jgi:hypothetical protein
LLAPAGRGGQRSICPKCLTPLTVPHPEHESTAVFGPTAGGVETPLPAVTDAPADVSFESPDLNLDEISRPIDVDLQPVTDEPALQPVAVVTVTPEPAAVAAAPAPVMTAVMTATPAPRPQPPSRQPTRPTVRPDLGGKVVIRPSGLFSFDVAELSCAISMRMAPPPQPTADRTTVWTCWLLGAVVGLGTWVMGVLHHPAWLPYTALVGGTMAAFGYLWRAYLSGRGSGPAAGFATLLPPVGVVQLLRPIGGHGLRPLVYVLAGAGLIGLYAGGDQTRALADEFLGTTEVRPAAAELTPAEAVALLVRKADREAAKRALLKHGAAAEKPLAEALGSKAEPVVLAACEVLEQIGGEEALDALRKLADDPATTRAVRQEATAAAATISTRLNESK